MNKDHMETFDLKIHKGWVVCVFQFTDYDRSTDKIDSATILLAPINIHSRLPNRRSHRKLSYSINTVSKAVFIRNILGNKVKCSVSNLEKFKVNYEEQRFVDRVSEVFCFGLAIFKMDGKTRNVKRQ